MCYTDRKVQMHRQVAVLLVKHVRRALLTRHIGAAESEPYWLTAAQHVEHAGEVQLISSEDGRHDVVRRAKSPEDSGCGHCYR